MNILTKISVVVLVVLVLLACPIFITKTVVDPNWRAKYDDEASALAGEKLEHAKTKGDLRWHKQLLVQRDKDLYQALLEKKQEAERHEAELKKKEADIVEFKKGLAALDAKMVQLERHRNEDVARLKVLSDQLEKAREDYAKVAKENQRLADLARDRQTKVERLEKLVPVIREQIVEKDERIRELEAELDRRGQAVPTAATGDEGYVPSGSEEIRGTVTAVNAAKDIVSINVGSAKRLRAGMKLIVYRGSEFVGELRVDEVGPQESAGVMISKRLDPMQGDKVTNKLAVGGR